MPIFSEINFNPLKYPIVFRTPLRDFSSVWIEHVPFAFYIMSVVKPSVFVELGTTDGDSYCTFCQAVAELALPTRCFAINTLASNSNELHRLRQYHDPLYNQFSTLIQNTSEKAVERFTNGTIDFLHMESCDTYEAVKYNFETWRPKFSDRCVIVFHGINEKTGNFGVRKLFEELKDKYSSFEFFHGHGLGVVAIGNQIPGQLSAFFQLSKEEAGLVRDFFSTMGQRLSLSAALAEQQRVENELRSDIQVKAEQLNNLEQEIKSLRESTEQLEKLHAELQKSLAFTFLTRYRTLLERFFPQGSPQRRFYNFLIRRKWFSPRPTASNFSVIVFQRGNEGANIIQKSLVSAYKLLGLSVSVYQSEILTGFDKAEEMIHKEHLNRKQGLRAISIGRQIRKVMDRSGNHTWKIISLVQDPVARTFEAFFQVLEEYIPDWENKHAKGSLTVAEVQSAFLDFCATHSESDLWLDDQLLPVTGVDVLSEVFPRDTGYKIYNPDSKMPVLLIRLEDLDRIGGLALQEFLGINNLEIITTNMGKEKEYADIYRLFQQNPLPDNYLQEAYNTKYAKTFYTETEIAKFFVKWQKSGESKIRELAVEQDPIIVYQMGKVGSKTVEQSLLHYYESRGIKIDIYHTHFLNHLDKLEKDAIESGVSSHGIQKILEAQEIRKRMEQAPLQTWRVISLVRDPVARNIASFFQSLSVNELVPDWKERNRHGQLDIGELQETFLKLGEEYHQYPTNWFDSQLRPVFGIDVFTDMFPYQIGYKVYEAAGHNRLLVIRMENINDCLEQAMHEYLGLTEFKILNANLGTEKDYIDVYKRFKSLPLPAQYLDKIYDTKFARHFYSEKELSNLKAYWMAVSKDSSSVVFR